MRLSLGFTLAALCFSFSSYAHAQPVVLELFTSQGCSSCPPAEALLQKLQQQHLEYLTLSYHVDYWNGLGWPDPYSSAENTQRQRDYAAQGTNKVFTPELRINGRASVVGSYEDRVNSAIHDASLLLPITVTRKDETLQLTLPKAAHPVEADMLVLRVLQQATTNILRGENAGSNVPEYNIVRSTQRVAGWQGQADSLSLPVLKLQSGEYGVVIVQEAHHGRILAAQSLGR